MKLIVRLSSEQRKTHSPSAVLNVATSSCIKVGAGRIVYSSFLGRVTLSELSEAAGQALLTVRSKRDRRDQSIWSSLPCQ